MLLAKLFFILLTACLMANAQATETLFKSATIVNPESEKIVQANILVRDGKIVEVVKAVPKNFKGKVVNLHRRFVLPGFFDLHTHAWGNPSAKEKKGGLPQGRYLGYKQSSRLFLYSGVTGFLELGSSEKEIFEFRENQRKHPSAQAMVFAAGPLFTCKDGHGTEYGMSDLARIVNTPEEAVREVKSLVGSHRPDLIKVVYEHNRVNKATAQVVPTLNKETLAAVLNTAKSHGLKSLVHIGTEADIREAVTLGATAITHLSIGENNQGLSDETIALIKSRGTIVIPTLTVHIALSSFRHNPTLLKGKLISSIVDKDTITTYQNLAPDDARAKPWLSVEVSAYRQTVEKLARAGVPILAGTDAGNIGVFIGYSIHHEMQLLVASGLTTWQALRAATTAARDFLGLPPWLNPGSEADFVVLEKSPVENIAHTEKIKFVIQRGTIIDRPKLLR